MSMTNFRFLSRVQPALIQRQCKREERKESEYDELSFSFPSAACSYLKNQQLVIVLPEGSEELPIRIVRGSRSRREAHAHPSARLCANGLQAHQLRCPTAATSRPHVGCCLCTRLTTNGAIPCPVLRQHHGRVQVTEAILSHVHLKTPGTAQSGSGGNPSRLPAHEETDFGRAVGSSKYVTYESQADEKGCRWNVVLLLHIASSVVTPPDVPDGSRQSAERRAKRRRTVRRAVAGCPPPETANTPQTEAATGRTEAAPVRTVATTVGTESRAPPHPAAEQTGTRRGCHTAQVAPNPPTAVDEGRISALNADCEPVSGGNARDFRTSPKHKVTHGRITNSPVTPPLPQHRAKTPATASGICLPHEATILPHSTSASWTRSGHRSHPPHAHLTTPGTALHWAQPSVR